MTITCPMTTLSWIISVAIFGQICDVLHAQVDVDYEFNLKLYEQDIPWIQCPKDWRKFGIECIRVVETPASFLEAETVCNSYGGHLIEIDGLNLNKVVGQEAERSVTQAVWIGFYRDEVGFYKWTNGKQGVEQNGVWASGQPTVLQSGIKGCASLGFSDRFGRYRWSLEGCDLRLPFICQTAACVEGDFRCVDGHRCVSPSWVCDGVRDCDDGSDEAQCGQELCGGLLDETQSSFQSPGYPQSYSRWLDCQWVIQAPVGKKIELQFLSFSTEELYDVVTVRDGLSGDTEVLAGLSGGVTPDVLVSSTNYMVVQFKTDHSIHGAGFKATWRPVTSDCGSELKATETPAWVTSPTYQGHVRGNLDCDWIITADTENDLINLQFEDFSLSGPGQWIEIRDGNSREAPLIGRYTGDGVFDIIVSGGPSLHIHLQTDLHSRARGFNFTYQNGCDINIRADYGVLHSPGYKSGNQYPSNVQCNWFLAPIAQRETTLIIHSFHTELNYDTLQIFNNTKPSSDHHIIILSGEQRDWSVTSTTGQFLLKFVTDKQIGYQGWTASFSFGCRDNTSGSHISKSSSYVLYGSSINYSCDTGYQFTGTSPRVCDIAGEFRTPLPNCQLIHCGASRELLHGTLINLTSRYYDGVAYYTCDIGFNMIGSEKVTCLEDGWTEMPNCENLVCPKLPPLHHGRLLTPFHYHIYQRTEFVCSTGYRLVGYQSSECLKNGSWSHPVPMCVPEGNQVIYCEDMNILHGLVNQTEPIKVGDSVHVTCHHGYQLSEADKNDLKCVEGGKYDLSIPSCIDINECSDLDLCGAHTCVNTDGSFWCKCLSGFTHTQESQQFCVDLNGCLIDNGGCQQSCVNTNGSYTCECEGQYRLFTHEEPLLIDNTPLIPYKSCYVLCSAVEVDSATVYYSTTPLSDGSYLYPTTLFVHCDRGWVPETTNIAHCQEDGFWSNTFKCIAGDCGELDPIPNGAVNYTDGSHLVGSYGYYVCDTGYRLHGNCQRYCQQGDSQDGQFFFHWTGSQPLCIAVDCGPAPDLPHGNVTFQDTIYGSRALYECDRGFRLVGQSNRTCLSSGLWSTEVILCVALTCRAPIIPVYSTVTTRNSGSYHLGSAIQYTCDRPGYELKGPSVLECVDSDSLPKVETSLPGQMMVAMATLSVTSGEMSPHCADSSMAKIVDNLQDVTETLKQVCENPETFDLIIADAGANTGTDIAQTITEVHLNLSFTLEPRTGNGLQIPLDNECAVKIRTAFNEKIADYRSKFYVNPTFTCPTRLQLQSPVLTFQEPVILCLSGEPVRDENGILSCLVSQGNKSDNMSTEDETVSTASISISAEETRSMNKSIETSRSLPYEKTTKQSTTANRMNEIKSYSTDMVPVKLSASFTQQVEMSTTSQPVSADTDNVRTGTISDLNDNFETTMAENKMTTLPVVSENTLGTDETMDLKNNNLHNYTSVGMLETTFMTNTTQSVKDVENTEKVSSGQAQAIEKTVSTTVDINNPLSSAKEGAGGLEKTPSDVQTSKETTDQLHGKMTATDSITEKNDPNTNQTTVQGKSYKSFLDTVKDKQKTLESLSNDSNVLESTTAFTNISEHANDPTVADIPLELEFVTNSLSVSSDTNSIATSPSTVATSILHVDSSALSSDVMEHPVTKPLTVCQCGTQHDSVPQLPSGYHIYPGPVFMIRVTIHLTVAASLEMDCLYEVRKVIQTSSQQAIDDLRLQEVCPDLPDVQITNTTGVLKIENNNIDIHVPFFIEDPTADSNSIQSCGLAVQDVFKPFFETQLVQAFSGDIGFQCPKIVFDSEKFDIPQPSWVCGKDFIFDEATGECAQCDDCSTGSPSTTTLATSLETTSIQIPSSTSEPVSTTQTSPSTSTTSTSLPETTSEIEETTSTTQTTSTDETVSTAVTTSTASSTEETVITSTVQSTTYVSPTTKTASTETSSVQTSSVTATKEDTTSTVTEPTDSSTHSTITEQPTFSTTGPGETTTLSTESSTTEQTTSTTVPVSTSSEPETTSSSTTSENSSTTTSTSTIVTDEPTLTSTQNVTITSEFSTSAATTQTSEVTYTSSSSEQTTRTSTAEPTSESTSSSSSTTVFSSTSASESTVQSTITEAGTTTSSTVSPVSSTTETILPTDPGSSDFTMESTSSATQTSTEAETTSPSTEGTTSVSDSTAISKTTQVQTSSIPTSTTAVTDPLSTTSVETTAFSSEPTSTETTSAKPTMTTTVEPSSTQTTLSEPTSTESTSVEPTSPERTSEPTSTEPETAEPPSTTESEMTSAQSTTSGLTLCELEAVDPALIKEHTDFPPSIPQTHIWFNGSLKGSSADSTCLREYEAVLIELLVDSELQLNAQSSMKQFCQDLGLHIRFTRVQLSHESNSNKIDLQLAVSLLAKTTEVTEDDATNCASFIMTFPDFSYLMCLLNTTELQTHSWGAGEECDTIHLDGTSQLMVVDFNYSCTEGYQYVERTDADGHKCISTHETTTSSTSPSTTRNSSTSTTAASINSSTDTTTTTIPSTTNTDTITTVTSTSSTTSTSSSPSTTSSPTTTSTAISTSASITSTTTTVPSSTTTTTATTTPLSTTSTTIPTTTTTATTSTGTPTSTTTTTTVPTTTTTTSTVTTTEATTVKPMTCYTCEYAKSNEDCITEVQTCTAQQDVCETRISYENKAIKQIWKGCDTSALCDRKKNGSIKVCTTSYFRPYCVYCCNTARCNEDIELLQFKGKGRKKRSVPEIVSNKNEQKLVWNTTAPSCVDIQRPMFTQCPSYEIDETDIPILLDITIPTAVDNSGMEPAISVSPKDFTNPYLVTENASIMFTATDHGGLQSYCYVKITIRDKTPPILNCPSTIVSIQSDTMETTDSISFDTLNIIDNPGDVAMVTYTPSEGSEVKVLDNINVTMTAADHQGNIATCTFTLVIKATGCPLWTLRTPALGKKECKTGTKTYCSMECLKGSQFVVQPQQVYTCTERAKWEPDEFVADCVSDGLSRCPVWTYSLNWTLEIAASTDVGCNVADALAKALTDTLQADQTVVTYLNTSLSQTGDTVIVTALVELRAKNDSTTSCPILNMGQLNNLQLSADCIGNGGALTLKNPDMSVSVGCPSDMVLDNSTGGAERCWPCPPGMEAHTAVCQPCPVGKYRDSLELTGCLDCPVGMSTIGTHSTNQSQCIALCGEGEFSASGIYPCTKCPQGQYQPSKGSRDCEHCPEGMDTPHTGATSAEECKAPCSPGSHSPSGLQPCLPCPLNHYSENPGSTACTPCLGNSVTKTEGATSSTACEEIDHCDPNPCSQGSTCSNYSNGFTCFCPAHNTGILCDHVIKPCDSSPCFDRGTCENVEEDYLCHCFQGYAGFQCEKLINLCDLDPCNYGDCVSDGHTQSCVCYTGFTGPNCTKNIDNCQDNLCQNGECVDLLGYYSCNCTGTGYTGQYCNETESGSDISSCEVPTSPCMSSPCENDGHCISEGLGHHYTCYCKPGYSGSDCGSEVDSCETSQCINNGRCTDLPNGFSCSCPSGYSGLLCEVRLFNYCGSSPCDTDNTLECLDDNVGYTCYCKPGWTGTNCGSKISQCDSQPCMNNATCVDEDNHYTCQCTEGFSGSQCQVTTNHCERLNSPCSNGGTCTSKGVNYTCSCPPGFHGDHCQNEVDACQSSPCVNGDCVDLIYDFMCSCYPEWTGHVCDEPMNHCYNLPCYNQGTCSSTVDGFHCACTDDYTGPTCETKINRCEPDPCQNSASCHDDGNQSVCSCLSGYHGYWCEESDDVCESLDPCKNGATCVNTGSQPVCQCMPAYVGKYCEKEKSSDFDLVFHGSGSMVHTVTVESKELNQFSLCLWVRVLGPGGQAKILVLKDTESSDELVVIEEDLITISLTKDVLPLKTSIDLGDRGWHQVCLLWVEKTQGQWGVYLDGVEKRGGTQYVQNHHITTRLELSIGPLAKDNNSATFHGEVTSLNMRTSTDLDLSSRSTCAPQLPGDLVSWVMFDDAGSKVVHPSSCPSNKRCPPGYQHQNCSQIDKESPIVVNCPPDKSVLLSSNELRVTVSWDEPQFIDNINISDIKQTHMSGDLFTFGEYLVSYMAFDAAKNWAVCSFKIFVIPHRCKTPKVPNQTLKQCKDWEKGKYCTVSCIDSSHYDFTEKPPDMYICGSEGYWDPPGGSQFILPPCAGFNMASSLLTGSLRMTAPVCSDDYKTSLLRQLENQLTGYQLCQDVDCVKENTVIDCARVGNMKRDADLSEPVIYTVSFDIPANTSAVSEDSFEEAVTGFQSYIKQLDGFELREQSYNISLQCELGQVLTQDKKCVNCGVGYYWQDSECKLCPLGTYTDKERQLACTSCPAGETTSVKGAYSATFCFKVCSIGEFMLDGVCEPCEMGFYQDELGQTSCKPCPLGQTTHIAGTSSLAGCIDICGSAGIELTESGSCSPCEKGFYKVGQSDISCLPCPFGFTTLTTGATEVSMCSYVQCDAGRYRTENNSCEPCPIGTYSRDETCHWCPKGHTTLQPGSVSANDCVWGLVDECSTGFFQCPDHAMCADTDNYYICLCETGYSQVGSVCQDNCKGECDHGLCVKNSAGEPSCICDNGYHGPDCSIEEGLSGVTIAVVVCSVTVFLAVVMLVFAFLFRKNMFKKGQKLIRRPSSTNSKVHRSEHSSDFHAYAVALNPTFEMSSERSISITAGRQMSTHSQFSRHRTSRGEVSYSSRESYF